jgi:hypothetical protein
MPMHFLHFFENGASVSPAVLGFDIPKQARNKIIG